MTTRDEAYKELLKTVQGVKLSIATLEGDCRAAGLRLPGGDSDRLTDDLFEMRHKLSAAVARVDAEEDAVHKQRMRYLRSRHGEKKT